jgi:membrane-bound lytic murein transglycosylase MltF
VDDVATKRSIWPTAELSSFQSSRREDEAVRIPRRRKRFVPAVRLPILLLLTWLLLPSCQKKQAGAAPEEMPAQSLVPNENAAATGTGAGTLTLPTGFGKRTGDLDEMVKGRSIRALVIVNPIGFFYSGGKPEGIQYEALEEFEKFVNQKLNTGKLPVKVVFLPMRPDQLEAALNQGLGDMIAQGVAITPQREQRVAFSTPVQKDVTQVVVTGSALANVSSFDGLAGKAIYVNPLTTYYDNLKSVSDAQRKAGKAPLDIRAADKNLFDDDLIEMVNAGLIPATVTNRGRADLWAQVLPNVKSHPDLIVASGGQTAWVMRKNNPQFKQLVDEFVESHAVGTSFGNTLLRRYLQNTKWIKNSTSTEEMQKFSAYEGLFKKYAGEYNFDYLMVAAQGYQESLLDQDKKSRVGAVGIMQVIPKLAAANPIDIPNVSNADGNIQAGCKMLRNITDTYFNDPGINPLNKTLFTFASYNAGPNKIVALRKKAQDDGLDPNKWFGNVELEVAKAVGEETVNYVGNIYKYYVAYKLTVEQKQHKAAMLANNLAARATKICIFGVLLCRGGDGR